MTSSPKDSLSPDTIAKAKPRILHWIERYVSGIDGDDDALFERIIDELNNATPSPSPVPTDDGLEMAARAVDQEAFGVYGNGDRYMRPDAEVQVVRRCSAVIRALKGNSLPAPAVEDGRSKLLAEIRSKVFGALDPKDWLYDGQPIRGLLLEYWQQLDWSRAWVDLGPSIAGNLGPYWHVPRAHDDDETVHRLYPKLLTTKWAMIAWLAAAEIREKANLLQSTTPPAGGVPEDRCDYCDNGIEKEWLYCAFCGDPIGVERESDTPPAASPGQVGEDWIEALAKEIAQIERNTWRDSDDLARLLFQMIASRVRAAPPLREALEALLPPHLEWKEAGDGLLYITVHKEDLRKARAALTATPQAPSTVDDRVREALEKIVSMFSISLGVAGLNGQFRISEIYDIARAALDPKGKG